MPINDSYQSIHIDSIVVNRDERQRREIITDDLQASIKQIGLINPIVIRWDASGRAVLVAGERRLEACRALGYKYIPVRYAQDLSSTEANIIELEENIKRSDLEWKEVVLAADRVHRLHLELDPDWTMAETAQALSVTLPTVSVWLRVARELKSGDARVIEAGTVREAYNVISRRDQRAMGNALEDLLHGSEEVPSLVLTAVVPQDSDNYTGTLVLSPPSVRTLPTPTPPPPSISESILHQSFLEWAPAYSGPKFNLIHCDFPYGIDPFQGPQGRGASPDTYEDDPDIYFKLLECLCANAPRLFSVSSHLMFWYSDKLKDKTLAYFHRHFTSMQFQVFPLIWVKTNNAGISPDAKRTPRHIYETCLLGSLGGRNLVRIMADAYAAPSDPRLHPHTKPESMLRHFMTMLVDEHSLVLDPTCGSGSSLRAAESLGASSVLGLESSWDYCETARRALRDFRVLRTTRRTA